MTHKTHFQFGWCGVRCGRNSWYNSTIHAAQVTCKSCLRLMKGTVE